MPSPSSSPTFRPDIQGLRAIAILAVLAYHARLPFVEGGFLGVDMFFVLSGYLISDHLLRELESTGTIRLRRFYGRRIRRLLPASLLVLGASVAITIALAPPLLAMDWMKTAAAAALYVPNVYLAYAGTDYLSEGAPSAFQHYWSLGVEEQFYAIWPLLLVVLWLVARSRRRMLLGVAAIGVASFIVCLLLMNIAESWAFFSLPSRAWEFAVGAAIAAAKVGHHLPRVARSAVLGLAAVLLLVSIVYVPSTVSLPGWWTIVPVLGTAAILIVGEGRPVQSEIKIWNAPGVQFLGRISYSLYLVHWPVLILTEAVVTDGRTLPQPALLLLAAMSIPLAWLLHVGFENRWRQTPLRPPVTVNSRRRRKHPATAMGAFALVSVLIAGVSVTWEQVREDQPLRVAVDAAAGTELSDLHQAREDLPSVYNDGCMEQLLDSSELNSCALGATDESRSVALLGDSHAAQWADLIGALATREGADARFFLRSSCSAAVVEVDGDSEERLCNEWRRNALDRINSSPPDVLFISSYSPHGADVASSEWHRGLERLVDELPATTATIFIADTPRFPSDPAACMSSNTEEPASCAVPLSEAVDSSGAAQEVEIMRSGGALILDLTDSICPAGQCRPVGDVIKYRDAHHLTATYADTFDTQFESALDEALDD